METSIKMDDLGVPIFLETSKWISQRGWRYHTLWLWYKADHFLSWKSCLSMDRWPLGKGWRYHKLRRLMQLWKSTFWTQKTAQSWRLGLSVGWFNFSTPMFVRVGLEEILAKCIGAEWWWQDTDEQDPPKVPRWWDLHLLGEVGA